MPDPNLPGGPASLTQAELDAAEARLLAESQAEAEALGADASAALGAGLHESRLEAAELQLRMQAGEAAALPPINWRQLGIVLTGTLLGPLGGMIVGIAQPHIAADFDIDLQSVKWLTLIFWVVTTFLVPVTGFLGRRFGEARMFTTGMALDGIGTLICALVPDAAFGLLLAARCVQGLGSAMMFALFGALVARIVPPERRGLAFGLAGATAALAVTLAPLLGGLLLDHVGWRGIFLIQLPLHALGFIGGRLLLPRDAIGKHETLPLVSIAAWLLLTCSGVLLTEVFSKGLLIERLPLLIVIALLSGGLFVYSELRLRPLFNHRLFRIPAILHGSFAFLIVNLCLFVMLLLLPFYLKDYLGLSNSKMGLYLGLSPLLTLLIAPLAGGLSDRLGFRLPLLSGLLVSVSAYALLALGIAHDVQPRSLTHLLLISAGMALLGISGGLINSPLTSAMMGAAGDELRAQASSLTSLTRNLGFMGGTSLGALGLTLSLWRFGGEEMMLAARSEQITRAVPLELYQQSVSLVFWICSALLSLALLVNLRFPNRT